MAQIRQFRRYTGCHDTLYTPPQPKLKVTQYNQTYCWKVKSISGMDFQYFRRTKMLQVTKITLKARRLFAFSSPCMDSMEYFYIGVATCTTFLLIP